MHAFIKKTAMGEYIVEDNQSKFGTLALIRKPMILNNKQPNFI